MRGGSEGSRKVQCKQIIRDSISCVYMATIKNEHLIVLDSIYEHGNIYVYKQVGFAPVDRLREMLGNAWDKQYLVYPFIKAGSLKNQAYNMNYAHVDEARGVRI